jgi:uncharacterized protein DUF3182
MSAGAVVVYFSRLGGFMYTHERVALSAVAEAIAEIKHCEFAARFDDAERHAGSVFFVPDDTLIADEAAYLGIRGPNDLYGGVVPYPFAKTKRSLISWSTPARIDQKAGRLPSRKRSRTSCCRVTPFSTWTMPGLRQDVSWTSVRSGSKSRSPPGAKVRRL